MQSPPHQSQLLVPERLQERQEQPKYDTVPEHGLSPSTRSRSGPEPAVGANWGTGVMIL